MAITWTEQRNFPVIEDPATANPPDLGNGGQLYAGNESALVGGVADGQNAYYGPVAGKWLWGRPGVDVALVQQAMQIAGAQIQRWAGNPGAVRQYLRDMEAGKSGVDSSGTLPWNWAATTHWIPLGPSGTFEAPTGYYGGGTSYGNVSGASPWFMLSQGYQVVSVSAPHIGSDGLPYVTVTYQRTGGVPLPNQGVAPEYDPHALPWFNDLEYHMAHDVADAPSAAQSAANLASIPTLGQNFPGTDLFTSGGVPAPVPTTIATIPSILGANLLPSSGGSNPVAALLGSLTGGGGGGGGLGGMLPLLLIFGVGYMVFKKR